MHPPSSATTLPSGALDDRGRPTHKKGDSRGAAMTAQPKPQADDPHVLTRLDDGVLRLTLNRPAQRNPLSTAMMASLQAGLDRAAVDDAVRVIILAGAGPAFSSGHDLRELKANPEEAFYKPAFPPCSPLMLTTTKLPTPPI